MGLSVLFIRVALTRVPDPNVMLAHRFTVSALLMLLPVLGEPWSWALLLGGALILVGVRQVTRPK